jgi:transcriptional regulator with XRE-family HTH domain
VIRLKFERLDRGWSLATASQRLGITDSTLCLIERRRLVPTEAMLHRLASAYDVQPASALLQDISARQLTRVGVSA